MSSVNKVGKVNSGKKVKASKTGRSLAKQKPSFIYPRSEDEIKWDVLRKKLDPSNFYNSRTQSSTLKTGSKVVPKYMIDPTQKPEGYSRNKAA